MEWLPFEHMKRGKEMHSCLIYNWPQRRKALNGVLIFEHKDIAWIHLFTVSMSYGGSLWLCVLQGHLVCILMTRLGALSPCRHAGFDPSSLFLQEY